MQLLLLIEARGSQCHCTGYRIVGNFVDQLPAIQPEYADLIALEMLRLLTAETPSEILGLFMEDTELLSLADLPVAREYCCLTQVERQLNSADLQRQLRIQARSAQQALAAIAERIGFSWSFQTVRGSLASLLENAAEDMDLMLLGAARRSLPIPGHFASMTLTRPSR